MGAKTCWALVLAVNTVAAFSLNLRPAAGCLAFPSCSAVARVNFQTRVLRLCGGTATSMRAETRDDLDDIRALTERMKGASTSQTPFSAVELDTAIASLKMLADDDSTLDWASLRLLFSEVAHVSHKDWPKTEAAAAELRKVIGGPDDAHFQRIMQRVLVDGNWPAASAAAEKRAELPWVVLVTGVNGIRKTSSVYQMWFKKALQEALGDSYTGTLEELPDGTDSFFRQLDYMMATLANKEFARLYKVQDINEYASLKDGIFQRYRKLAEMLGVLLVKEAQAKRLNVMVETSGRDVAMFKYVDQFFPEGEYRKLVVHFTINDISFAEQSVDTRMVKEMADGRAAGR